MENYILRVTENYCKIFHKYNYIRAHFHTSVNLFFWMACNPNALLDPSSVIIISINISSLLGNIQSGLMKNLCFYEILPSLSSMSN